MKTKLTSVATKITRALVAPVALAAVLTAAAYAATYKVINTFTATNVGPLISDAAGNLYGVDDGGHISRTCGCGTVFELSPNSSGGWTKTILYSFLGGSDGSYPAAPLVFDAAGNLYGTTAQGGLYNNGTIYKLTPTSSAPWTEQILYSFTGGSDGTDPGYGLTLDASGNFYGTTFAGGIGSGVVFELSPVSGGTWSLNVLHTFTYGTDGGYPEGTLIFDSAGSLYGSTSSGGDKSCPVGVDGCGVIFRFTPTSSGWSYNVIHTFTGPDGDIPLGQMTFDASGNLYGLTAVGGDVHGCDGSGCGVVYEMSPGGGGWTYSILHVFRASDYGYDGNNGLVPYGVARDAAGNLYGATNNGGLRSDGVVFKLSPNSTGGWQETLLHTFIGGSAGSSPLSGVTLNAAGDIFGTTRFGGNLKDCPQLGNGCGVVYEITP
jgi:uncharacterized repeat protein (TIGR03803 family)